MLSSLTAAVRIDQIGELLRHNDAALPDLDVGINRSRSDIGIGVPVIGRSGPEGTGVRHLPPGNTCVTGIGIDGAERTAYRRHGYIDPLQHAGATDGLRRSPSIGIRCEKIHRIRCGRCPW
jgi:hypothetical protein